MRLGFNAKEIWVHIPSGHYPGRKQPVCKGVTCLFKVLLKMDHVVDVPVTRLDPRK